MNLAAQQITTSATKPNAAGAGAAITGTGAAKQPVGPAGRAQSSFSTKLGQALEPIDKSVDGDPLLLTLAALLAGLSQALALPNAAGQANLPQNGTIQLVEQIVQTLKNRPELLDKLAGGKDLQQWLGKAAQLLAGDGAQGKLSPQSGLNVLQLLNHPGDSKISADGQPTANPQGQTGAAVLNFLAAALKQPDNALFHQLAEDLQNLLQTAAAGTDDPGTSEMGMPVAQTVERQPQNMRAEPLVRQMADRNAPTAAVNKQQTAFTQANPAAPAVKPETQQAVKLEFLAYKAPLLTAVKTPAPVKSEPAAADPGISPANLPVYLPQTLLHAASSDMQAPPPAPQTAQSIVPDMSQFIVKNFKILNAGGVTEARLTLSPESLGHVDVKISMHDGQVVAQFAAQTILGKEALESQLSELKTALQNQGLQVQRIEVTQAGNLQSGLFHQQQHQQHSQQFTRQKKGSYGEAAEPVDDFTGHLRGLTDLRDVAYGTTLNVTA